ncbi:unnamed protein product [Agarophyton chilense]
MIKLATIDLFRKVPRDLTHATRRGGLLSLSVAAVIGVVLFCEVVNYVRGDTKSRLVLDSNSNQLLDINFSLSFFELPCRYATIEAWDFLGNSRLDVTGRIDKTVLSAEHGQIHMQPYKELMPPETERVAHAPGHATELDGVSYGRFLKENEYTFVLYYATWCPFCKMVLPLWQKLAATLPSVRPSVKVAQVDCVAQARLCESTKIAGYPTFMMFKGVNPLESNYGGHRTLQAFTDYVVKVSDTPPEEHPLKYQWHEGCLLRGKLQVNRVPGNFHVIAKSDAHNFDQKSTNTSHMVNHLSFGPPLSPKQLKKLPNSVKQNFNPLDNKLFVNLYGYMSHEHYIKVVSTTFETRSMRSSGSILGYQMTTSNQQYKADATVPEARFSYDLSPTAVVISRAGRRWYEFITSLCAIVGGTFTVFSLMDGVFHTLQRKMSVPLTPSSKLT